METQQVRVPKTVLAVKEVKLGLVSYLDDSGFDITQLAIIGDNTVHLIESRTFGFSKNSTPQGNASKWLADGVLELLKKGKKK